MKYKNRLIVPTLITTSLLTSGLVASADEKTEEITHLETNTNLNEPDDDINLEYQEDSTVAPAAESDNSLSEDDNSKLDNAIHNNSSISEQADNNLIEQQNNLSGNNTVGSTESEDDALDEVKEDLQKPSDKNDKTKNESLTHDENLDVGNDDTLNQDEVMEEEEDDILNPDEDLGEETEETSNLELNEDEEAANQDEDQVEKADHSPIQDEDIDEETEESINQDQYLGEEDDNASNISDKSEVRKNTSFLSSTFSTMSVEKANSDIITEVNYATKLKNNNSGLYSPVTSNRGVSANRFSNQTMFITQKTKVNGMNYYRIHNGLDGPMQGWMKESDLSLFNIYNHGKYNETFSVKSDFQDDYLLSDPWGTSKQRVKRIKDTGGSIFKTQETIKIGATVYHYGTIGDSEGWISDSRLSSDLSPQYSETNHAARIRSTNNSGIYSPVTSSNSVSANRFNNSTLFISEKADYNDTTFYKIHNGLDGTLQGWMKASDLGLYNIYNHKKYNNTFSVKSNYQNDYLLSEPLGASKQQVKKIKDTGGTIFNTQETIKIGAVTFYYGTIGDSKGWISDSRLSTDISPQYSSTSFAARIQNKNNNSGIYSPVTSNNSVSAKRFNNSTLFITEQADYDGTTYYKIHNSLSGAMQGWMKKNDLQTYGLGKVRNHSGSYSVKHDDFGLFSDPYGNSSQRIGTLKNYKNTPFKAEKSIKIGATTHYYGSFGNQKGWISNAALTKYTAPNPPVSSPKVNTVKYNRSLNSVLNTQMSLSAKPQAWVNGGGWRNATRSEVKHFLETSHQKGGAWDYTFLNLNQRQGISSSVLNRNLLNNKGILTNRGNAFSQAASQHGINEVYLISHAILETGHGSSQLAQGVKLDRNGNRSSNGTTYYNMYGVGAVDNNALLGGARYAQRMGWNTPEKAIIGGASFVSSNYFARGQNTLYSMRWNPRNPGTYQYATDVNWAYATARNLKNYYDQLGIKGQHFTRHEF